MDQLAKLEEKRLKYFQVYQSENKKGIIFLVLAIVIALIGFATTQVFIFLAVIVLIPGLVFFGKANAELSKFRSMFKNELIMTLLQEQFEDVVYNQHDMISIQRINQTQMIKRPDRYSGEDYIKGTYKGVGFEVSDIDLKERVETRDSKGNVHVSYQTYFKGRWYIYTFERHFKETLKILEGSGFSMNHRQMVKIDTESIEFNKKFAIYATTQEYGFYHITSSMIEKLLELEKMHRGSILYYFSDNELHIGVNDRRDYMELKIKTPINQESLKDFQADIDLIAEFVESYDGSEFNFEGTLGLSIMKDITAFNDTSISLIGQYYYNQDGVKQMGLSQFDSTHQIGMMLSLSTPLDLGFSLSSINIISETTGVLTSNLWYDVSDDFKINLGLTYMYGNQNTIQPSIGFTLGQGDF